MPAHLWWDTYGSSVAELSELQYVARLVLSQPASASICEKINSEFAFVKDRRRNRLKHARANKLVSRSSITFALLLVCVSLGTLSQQQLVGQIV